MPLYRAMVTFLDVDTGFVRDGITCVPWFNDHGVTTDPDNLAGQIADAFQGSASAWAGTTRKVKVQLYKHTPGDPTDGPPVATVTRNPAAAVFASLCPREVSLCLSYYAGTNTVGKRGRLYLPMCIRTGAGADVANPRPPTALCAAAAGIGTKLSAVGGVDVDWVLHSVKADASFTVTNVWVDDEWDTQRRRGLRPTTRQLLAVSG